MAENNNNNLGHCESLPPNGGTPLTCSSLSKPSSKYERLYKIWPGNNKFLCGGRLILGPDAGSLYMSSFLICCPTFIFFIRMLVRIKEHDPLYGYAVLTAGVLLTFLDLMFLYLTCARDPGIVPRNLIPLEDEQVEGSSSRMEWGGRKTPSIKVPRTKDMVINGHTITVKFCETCRLYRPPRASHCSICNNCVQKFDHHCPWVGQCIGLRNYRYFIFFVSTSTLLCIYVFTFSLINLIRHKRSFVRTLSYDAVSVILVVYCFVAVWFVGGLTIFHFYLIFTNQTTYENFRYRYDKDKNPHNLGISNNIKQIFLNKIPSSSINFRQMVLVEDYITHESSYYNGPPRDLDVEVAHRISTHGTSVMPGLLKNLDYTGMDEMLTKEVVDHDASFNLMVDSSEVASKYVRSRSAVQFGSVSSMKGEDTDVERKAASVS